MIPDKLYYKIGEVALIAEVEPYVLRYWESEFKEISPIKSKSNQRLYRKKDIETVLLIKKLLYAEGFTIEGARKRIRELRHDHEVEKDLSEDPSDQMSLGFSEEVEALKKTPSHEDPAKSAHAKVDTKFFKNVKKELEELLHLLQR